jgi:hypothetical protein
MGILQKIVGKAGVGAVEAIGGVMGQVFKNKQEKLSHEEIMARIAMSPQTAQHEINKIEAAHRSVFVAGWRPAIGWVAAVGLFFFYVPQYVMASWLWVKAVNEAGQLVPYPTSADGLLELVLALLGMGALRTVEKLQGRAK